MGNKNFLPKSLHHGTIMLNVNIDNMMKFLNPNKLKLISKGIDSVKSRVVNLSEIYPEKKLDKNQIFSAFESEFLKYYNITEYDKIVIEDETNEKFENENKIISELYKKYSSWNWLFGECPEFSNSLFHKFDFGLIDLSLIVEKGIIEKLSIYSDSLNTEFIEIINSVIKNLGGKFKYDKEGIKGIFDILLNDIEINTEELYLKHILEMKEVFMEKI